MKVSVSLTQQNNTLPKTGETRFKFILNEQPVFGWKPQLDTYKFLTVLSNLTALKIRANLSPEGETFLYDVRLQSARPSTNGGTANWVENCTCPRGYVGQFCESCDQGYTRNIPGGSRFAKCIPCNCRRVSYDCHREAGTYNCPFNTDDEFCKQCTFGCDKKPLSLNHLGCERLPCSLEFGCKVLQKDQVSFTECPIDQT
ncbi:laminin subunit gamma-1-like, partial [Limulus polyphemus]|uniref:Laminin subunit gamma-1-like n=1 Tax=Limulus polyphemus TaxID=6850 RepID=A0ABM1TFJ1_LIMPO